jgi:hypothetical protein
MIIELNSTDKLKLASRVRYFTQFLNYIMHMILHGKSFITLQILLTTEWPPAEAFELNKRGEQLRCIVRGL